MMRRSLDKAITAGTAVVIVLTVLLPWAWCEAKRARRNQQPQPSCAAST